MVEEGEGHTHANDNAVDVGDGKSRVQIGPLQARRAKAPSYPLRGFTLVLLSTLQ